MAGSEDKMIVLLAEVLYWGRYYLGVSALNNWNIHMETVVVADSDLVPVLIGLFSVSSVSDSPIVTSPLRLPQGFHKKLMILKLFSPLGMWR